MNKLDLSDFFTTKAQSVDFSTRLSAVSQQVFATGFSLETTLIDQFGLQKKDKFIALLRDNTVKVESNSALQEFFAQLQTQISSLPVATITLAFEPDETALRDLSEWFFQNLNRQVLFDIQIDPDLIAGTAVLFNGKYQDLSVKGKFNQILTDTINNVKPDTTAPAAGHQSLEHFSLGRP
jgi:F0F1-type ATP synthase delta subunit